MVAVIIASSDSLSEIDIDIIVDNVRKNYKVKDRDIIDLGFNKHNIKTVVLDSDYTNFNIKYQVLNLILLVGHHLCVLAHRSLHLFLNYFLGRQ